MNLKKILGGVFFIICVFFWSCSKNYRIIQPKSDFYKKEEIADYLLHYVYQTGDFAYLGYLKNYLSNKYPNYIREKVLDIIEKYKLTMFLKDVEKIALNYSYHYFLSKRAVEVLGEIGDCETSYKLAREYIYIPYVSLRKRVLFSLKRIGCKQPVEENVIKWLNFETENDLKIEIIDLINYFEIKVPFEYLIEILNTSKDVNLKAKVIETLGKLYGEKARGIVEKYINSDDPLIRQAVYKCGYYIPSLNVLKGLHDNDEEVKKIVLDVLKFRSVPFDTLKIIFKNESSDEIRSEILKVMGISCSDKKKAFNFIKDYIDTIHNENILISGLYALSYTGLPEVIDYYTKIFNPELYSDSVLEAIVECVNRFKNEKSSLFLFDVVNTFTLEDYLRAKAAYYLRFNPTDTVCYLLVKSILENPDDTVGLKYKFYALKGFGEYLNKYLEQLLRSEDDFIREKSLSLVNDSTFIDILFEMAYTDSNENIRIKALRKLVDIGIGKDELERFLFDKSPSIREETIYLIADNYEISDDLFYILRDMFEKYIKGQEDTGVANAVLYALVKSNNKEVYEYIIKIFNKIKHKSVKLYALNILGRYGIYTKNRFRKEKIRKFLLSCLKSSDEDIRNFASFWLKKM